MYSKQLFFFLYPALSIGIIESVLYWRKCDANAFDTFSRKLFNGSKFNARRTKIINGDFIAETKWIHRILNPSIVQTWLANNLINWINNNWISLYLFEPRITLFPLFLYFSSNFLFFFRFFNLNRFFLILTFYINIHICKKEERKSFECLCWDTALNFSESRFRYRDTGKIACRHTVTLPRNTVSCCFLFFLPLSFLLSWHESRTRSSHERRHRDIEFPRILELTQFSVIAQRLLCFLSL